MAEWKLWRQWRACERAFGAKATVLLLAIFAFSASVSASWLPTGPFGGDADIVRAIPQTKGHIIAAARNGLVFSSTNGGASWTNLPFPAQFAGVLHALEVDPKSAGTWYAGVESEIGRVSGVYKTTDSGATWKQLPGTAGIGVWSLALWPGDNAVIAAGTSSGRLSDARCGRNMEAYFARRRYGTAAGGFAGISSGRQQDTLCGHDAFAVENGGWRGDLAIDSHRDDRRLRRFQYRGGRAASGTRDGERMQRSL